jgi:hypothetical protein
MAELDAATEFPPCCPSDNSNRLDRKPFRLVEKAEGVAFPITRGGKGDNISLAKRKMSEQQLETLRKAREAKAAKARGLHPPPPPPPIMRGGEG